jgi:hypothetical protein
VEWGAVLLFRGRGCRSRRRMRLLSALVVAAAVVTGEGTRENLRGLIAAGLEASTAGRAGAGRQLCFKKHNEGGEGDGCSLFCSCAHGYMCDFKIPSKCRELGSFETVDTVLT